VPAALSPVIYPAAPAARPAAGSRDRFLIIEFKGLKAGEPGEEAKPKYLAEYSAPAVSRMPAGGQDHGEWRTVWIERLDEARDRIAGACGG